MSDELNISKKRKNQIKTKSSAASGRGETDIDYVRPAELPEQDLYHGHSFISISSCLLKVFVFCC